MGIHFNMSTLKLFSLFDKTSGWLKVNCKVLETGGIGLEISMQEKGFGVLKLNVYSVGVTRGPEGDGILGPTMTITAPPAGKGLTGLRAIHLFVNSRKGTSFENVSLRPASFNRQI